MEKALCNWGLLFTFRRSDIQSHSQRSTRSGSATHCRSSVGRCWWFQAAPGVGSGSCGHWGCGWHKPGDTGPADAACPGRRSCCTPTTRQCPSCSVGNHKRYICCINLVVDCWIVNVFCPPVNTLRDYKRFVSVCRSLISALVNGTLCNNWVRVSYGSKNVQGQKHLNTEHRVT